MTLETLAPSTPVETVTPIKPSEAIRLGCLIAPRQAFGNFKTGRGTACVVEAARLGVGWTTRSRVMEWLNAALTDVENQACPVEGCSHRLAWPPHLNDVHRWSRERIADYLETLGL